MNEQTITESTKLTWREIQLIRQRASIEREVGLLLANSETASGGASERIARLTAELQANEAGIKGAQTKRLEIIRAQRESEIVVLGHRRAELETERSTLLVEIEKHQKALTELLGVGIRIVTTSGPYSKPDALGLKITGMDNQIAQLRAPFPDTGVVDVENATTIDPLVEALAASEVIIPPLTTVLEWLKAVEPVPGETFRDLPRRIRLVWANGEIDYQQSTVFVEGLCAPGRIGMYSGKPMGVNIDSGTFRARRVARP